MHRLEKYSVIILANLVSKSFFFLNRPIKLHSLSFVAGLYKINGLTLEHNLILSALTGVLSVLKFQLHRRQDATVSVGAVLIGKIM